MTRPSLTGSDLRHLRRSQQLTQKDLAAALGLDQSTISLYERGSYPIPDELVPRILRLLSPDRIPEEVSDQEISGQATEISPQEPLVLTIHKEKLIRQLSDRVQRLAELSPGQLYRLENRIEELKSKSCSDPVARYLLDGIDILFPCDRCRSHYGSCAREEQAEGIAEARNICRIQWMNYAGTREAAEVDDKSAEEEIE